MDNPQWIDRVFNHKSREVNIPLRKRTQVSGKKKRIGNLVGKELG